MSRMLVLTAALCAAVLLASCSRGSDGGGLVVPFGPAGPVGPAGTVGPADNVNGFPAYYRDGNGLALALCDNPADPLCIASPVDPANPFSVRIGFGSEAFWWNATATMDVNPSQACPACSRAILVLGLEAAFAVAGAPAQGQQITFSRLRIRIDAPAAGQYTVTHPYGRVTFEVAAPDVRAINSEAGAPIVPGTDTTNGLIGDIGCLAAVPCDFTLALGGATFPFLVWDPAALPAAPAGYIGDPALDHKVTGSPTGNNFFRVQGPVGSNLDGAGGTVIQTDLFAVQGKIF